MIAYHGKASVKAKYLARVQAHRAADEIAQGYYWENGKGCAVGCTIHGDEHSRYETELGIPRTIARLEDRIFELLSNKDAKEFPVQFLEAVPVGADLSMVMPKFLLWVLGRARRHAKGAKTKEVIDAVIALYERKLSGDEPTLEEWSKAEGVAWGVRRAAAETAAWAEVAAAAAAWAAEKSAEEAAAAAAWAVEVAAAAEVAEGAGAVEAARAAGAAEAAEAARQSFAAEMRDKLLELLRR